MKLHDAIRNRKIKLVSELLETEPENVNVNEFYGGGYLPLELALNYGNYEIAKLLVEAGAVVNPKPSRYFLHAAIEAGEVEIVKALLKTETENVNEFNDDGYTPLELALNRRKYEIAKLLIEAEADVTSDSHRYYLFQPFNEESLEIVELLIERGADINYRYCGMTRFMESIMDGNIDAAMFFLKKGADVTIKDSSGKSPLDLALEKGFHDLAREIKAVIDASILADGSIVPDDVHPYESAGVSESKEGHEPEPEVLGSVEGVE